MMKCPEFIEFIEAYLSNQLPENVVHDFNQHLKWCPDCRNYLQSYKQTVELGKTAMCGDDKDLDQVPQF